MRRCCQTCPCVLPSRSVDDNASACGGTWAVLTRSRGGRGPNALLRQHESSYYAGALKRYGSEGWGFESLRARRRFSLVASRFEAGSATSVDEVIPIPSL